MDKKLVNNQIVTMRKHVKIARNRISQKIYRSINQIKQKIVKWENIENVDNDTKQKHLCELNQKLQSRQIDAKELKSITPDTISKKALVHDDNFLDSLLKKANTPVTERLIARVCQNPQIQSCVKKFRLENPGYEQWLPVQIELWYEKRKIQKDKLKNVDKTGAVHRQNNDIQKEKNSQPKKASVAMNDQKEKKQKQESFPTEKIRHSLPKLAIKKSPSNPRLYLSKKRKSFASTFQVTQLNENSSNNDIQIDAVKTKSAVIKRINLNSMSDKILDDDESDTNNLVKVESSPKKMPVKDGFFLGKQNDNDKDPITNIEEDFIQMHYASDDDQYLNAKPNNHNNKNKTSNDYKKKFHKSFNGKKFDSSKQNKSFTPNVKRRYFDVDDRSKSERIESNRKIHPSWQAKMQSKERQKKFNQFFNEKTE